MYEEEYEKKKMKMKSEKIKKIIEIFVWVLLTPFTIAIYNGGM